MIVRRIREHAGAMNWFAVAVDLLVAIVGVFIGIQVSNWNQGRLNRAEGHEYRQRLIDDLADNESDLADRGRYYAAVEAHAKAALSVLDAAPGPGDAQFLIDAFEATQIVPRKLKRYTYDELLARGAMTWIGDAKLREQVANFYVGADTVGLTFAGVMPYRELVRTGMPDAAQQAVRRACPERIYITPEGAGQVELAPRCAPLALDPAMVAGAAATVRALPGLRGALNRQISDHDAKLLLIQPSIDHARDLARQLAAADRNG